MEAFKNKLHSGRFEKQSNKEMFTYKSTNSNNIIPLLLTKRPTIQYSILCAHSNITVLFGLRIPLPYATLLHVPFSVFNGIQTPTPFSGGDGF